MEHPEFRYAWTNPLLPDPVEILNYITPERFKDRVMRNAYPVRNSKVGSYFERIRSFDEMASVIYEESESPISRGAARELFRNLDTLDIPYNENGNSGFLRIERAGDTDNAIIQDFPWNCLAC